MSRQYDNTNRGALFKNKDKSHDAQPDYSGSINVEGAEFRIAAWLKDGKNGRFMSLALTPKDERTQATKPSAPARMEEDDDIPF